LSNFQDIRHAGAASTAESRAVWWLRQTGILKIRHHGTEKHRLRTNSAKTIWWGAKVW
jgi:hypothetical protein